MSASEAPLHSPDGAPVAEATDRAAWREWLEANHESEQRVWLALAKKGSGLASVTYDEAVEEALAFGWIDSRANRADDSRYLQLFSRRKPGSAWSSSNHERVARLIAEGRMTPAGMAAVERAKRDGTWEQIADAQANVIPADLAAALAASPVAKGHFDAFPPSSKRIILEWIVRAKRPETRAKRIEETVRLAAENILANHYRQPKGNGSA